MLRTEKLFLVCFLLFALLVVGCSEDEDDDPTGPGEGKPPAEMVDTWRFHAVTLNGAVADLATVMEWHAGTVRAEFYIRADGAYVFSELDERGGQVWYENGFVFVDGSSMDINVQFDSDGAVDEMVVVTFTLDGDVMTITEIDEGDTIAFALSRASSM